MVFFEPGVDFCLKLADTHGSYQIIKALRLRGSNHSLHARLDLRCPWPCPQLGYILVSQPQLGLPLVLASVVVYINGIPSESCHGLLVCDFPARTRAGVRDMDDSLFGHHIDCDHRIFLAIVRDSYVLHVAFNHPVRLSCPEIPLDSSPLKGPHSTFRPSFERLGVRPEKKVVAFYDIRDRRAAGNLVLLVIAQEYGSDFLCRVCRVLLPDASLSPVRLLRSETWLYQSIIPRRCLAFLESLFEWPFPSCFWWGNTVTMCMGHPVLIFTSVKMLFLFFILTQVLDSGCPICFLELT